MMKHIHKIMALLLTLAALFSFTACGDTTSSPAPTPSPNPDAAVAPAPEDKEGSPSEADPDIAWPERTIEIVVPASAGGANDLHARLYAQYFESMFGVPVIVTNMKDGGQAPAFRYVHDAEPDAYTILHTHDAFFINQVNGSIDFGLEDMTNLGITAKIAGQILVANTNKGWTSFEEMAEYAKANPDTVTLGMSVGSTTQVMANMLIDAGVPIRVVDTSGASERVTMLLGGHIDLAFMGYSDLAQYIESGDFVPLCVAASEREEACPDVPTAKELGYDVVFDSSFFMLTSPGVDQAIVDKLIAAFQEINAMPDYIEAVYNIDQQTAVYIPPEEAEDTMLSNVANLKKYTIQ